MHCHWLDRPYYDCRSNDSIVACRRSVREDRLLPWVGNLFTILDRHRPANLGEMVAGEIQSISGAKPRSTESPRRVQASLERIEDLYAMGHWPKERYLKERERLEQLLRELQAVVSEKPVAWAPLGSLTEGWRTGDPRTRRELICEFFDELNVEDGRIATAVPRRDRAAQVANLIEHAFDEHRRCSPGGIRTRDLSLERAAS
jgi:hypothetical protein